MWWFVTKIVVGIVVMICLILAILIRIYPTKTGQLLGEFAPVRFCSWILNLSFGEAEEEKEEEEDPERLGYR